MTKHSHDAEVAVIDTNGNLMPLEWFQSDAHDTVIGFVHPDEVARLIAEVRVLPFIAAANGVGPAQQAMASQANLTQHTAP